MPKSDYSNNLGFWDQWKPSAIDFSALRPREMWSQWGPPQILGGRGEEHPFSAANLRDLFNTGWHGRDWKREERGLPPASEGQKSEDRWAIPLFRTAMLTMGGGMANSFGSPFGDNGPGYGTTARAGGGVLNNLGAMGGLAGMLGGRGGAHSGGGYGPPIQPIQTYRDPLQDQGIPPGLMALLLQQAAQQQAETYPQSYGLGTEGIA